MKVVGRASGAGAESTVLGPSYVPGAPEFALGEDWQSDDEGHYDVRYDGLDHPQGRGLLRADGEGPVLVVVSVPGFRTLTTHTFASGDEFPGHDAVFGVRPSLIIDFTEQPPGTAPDAKLVDEPFFVAEFDIVLDPLQRRSEMGRGAPRSFRNRASLAQKMSRARNFSQKPRGESPQFRPSH
jgi:hypothetical protein